MTDLQKLFEMASEDMNKDIKDVDISKYHDIYDKTEVDDFLSWMSDLVEAAKKREENNV